MNLKGTAAPIKLKLEYYHTETRRLLDANEMIQLKGNVSIYLSQVHRDPKIFEKLNDEGKLVEIRQYELGYRKVVPPTNIDIKSNDMNL